MEQLGLGDGSLRNTILNACPGDTIRFDFSIIGEPIILSSGEIDLDKDLYILGAGLGDIVVNADNTSRIFKIVDPKTVVGIENLVMENGNANTSGGTISNKGHLLLKEVMERSKWNNLLRLKIDTVIIRQNLNLIACWICAGAYLLKEI